MNTLHHIHDARPEQALTDKLHSTSRFERLSSVVNPQNDEMGACLVRIYPPSIGEGIIKLPLGDVIFGRHKECDVVLDDPAVSRQHSCIIYGESGYKIMDLGSSNTTIVNDKSIKKNVLLKDGDMVRIGHMVFKYLSSNNIERHYHEEIYSMMITDGLTDIPNKRYFMEMLEREFNRARRHRRPLCLLMFDIDHFKVINDTHGHLAGDIILRDLCRRIAPIIRKEEVFARFGGEEFAIVLSETRRDKARVLGDKVLDLVGTECFKVEDIEIPVTISIGIAELDVGNHRSPNDLVEAADRKLYAAKENGRNCVVI